MKKLLPLILLVLLLSSCSSFTDELASVPKTPYSHEEISVYIEKIEAAGGTLTAPAAGNNRASVQLVDLDGDGVDEAVSFFLMRNDSGSFPRVYVHRKTPSGYEEETHIDGTGDSIDEVIYSDLSGDGKKSLIVGWRLGESSVRGMSVLSKRNDNYFVDYSGEYTGISVADLDSDGSDEIVVLRHSSSNEPGTATLLSFESGTLNEISSAPLSSGVSEALRVSEGYISYSAYAVICEGSIYTNAYISDALVMRNGVLINLFYSSETGNSGSTYRALPIMSCDINNDGIVEFPRSVRFSQTGDEPFWRVDWYRLSSAGSLERVTSTYLNITDRWSYEIPLSIAGRITLARGENRSDVKSVVFLSTKLDGTSSGDRLFEILAYTGDARFGFSEDSETVELYRTVDTVYALKLYNETKEAAQSFREIWRAFSVLQTEWIYENWWQNT